MEKRKHIVVIGAGPAGLTAAWELVKKGHGVTVLESSSQVGGMCKSFELFGQIVDLGPHRFFSKDSRINKIWLDAIQKEYSQVKRTTRIYYNQKYFDYPLKPFQALIRLGFLSSTKALAYYVFRKFFPDKNDHTFEGWVKNRFGDKLYEYFFKTYSEKLWGISCQSLDSDFAKQRIKKLSFFEVLFSSLSQLRKSKHKSLIEEFYYPNKGTGQVYENIASEIIKLGGIICYNTKINKVFAKNDSFSTVLSDSGQRFDCDYIISSMPITDLVKSMDSVPQNIIESANKLRFRNTRLAYLCIAQDNIFEDQWVYLHSNDIQAGRVTNFSNWNLQVQPKKTILCFEYWANDDDILWNCSDNDMNAIAQKDALSFGVQKKDILEYKSVKIPKCYPIYGLSYKSSLEPVKEYFKSFTNLSLIGRYGSFKYNNQDHSILMGLLIAENLTENKMHDLWEINSDYEYQEEIKHKSAKD